MNSEELKQKRAELGLSQEELGAALNKSRKTINGWEQGNIPTSAQRLLKLFFNAVTKGDVKMDSKKEKTSPGEARFEDLIAKKVYDMLLPVLGGYTENILKAIMDLHIELNEIKINQEETLETQKKCTEEQEQAGKILEKIGKNF